MTAGAVYEAVAGPAPAGFVVEQPAAAVGEVLSPTQLTTWMDCQAKWMFRYLYGIPERRSGALALGGAVHHAIAANFSQKIGTGEDLPAEAAVEEFRAGLAAELAEAELREDESAAALEEKGAGLVRLYMRAGAPAVRPAAVEAAVAGVIGGVRVQGRADVIDERNRVIDVKTSSSKCGMKGTWALQLATYVALVPGASPSAQADVLVKTKTPQLVQLHTRIGERELRAVERLYPLAQEGMRSGLYMPNRASQMCSRRGCGYWEACERKYGGTVGVFSE